MGDFQFKNLSVRLFPAQDVGDHVCIDAFTCDDTHTCGDLNSCGPLSECDPCTFCTHQTCGDPLTNQVVLARDVEAMRESLAAHKQRLQDAIERVETQEAQLAARTRASSLQEADLLREQLVAALAELDEYRAQLAGDQTPDPG